jgi:hypothetical protein
MTPIKVGALVVEINKYFYTYLLSVPNFGASMMTLETESKAHLKHVNINFTSSLPAIVSIEMHEPPKFYFISQPKC